MRVVLRLFAEAVRQPREPAHAQPHGQVLGLRIARADMLGIGLPGAAGGARAEDHRRTVAALAFGRLAEQLFKHGKRSKMRLAPMSITPDQMSGLRQLAAGGQKGLLDLGETPC